MFRKIINLLQSSALIQKTMSKLGATEINANGQQTKSQKESKPSTRMFDVVFRNMTFAMPLSADMTVGGLKQSVKERYTNATNVDVMDFPNKFIRIIGCSHFMLSDSDKLAKFLHFDLTNAPRQRLEFEQAIGTVLRIPNCNELQKLILWPSDILYDAFVEAFNVAKCISNNGGYEKFWFNLYCDRAKRNLCNRALKVKDVLINGDLLEMRFDHPREQKRKMQIFAKTLTGKTIGLGVLADGTDIVRDLKFMICCITGIQRHFMRLIYAGRQPDDDMKLCDWGIKIGSTIHVVGRMRGS